ncbi:MAG: T9SS C-terminal target domain-containing protein [Bacteroidetes bacterium]|nr:T9SS C-terminal target domain-containing protein [Bacteroidota bacterium]
MKFPTNQSLWALLIGGALLTATSCKKDDNEDTTPTPTPSASFTLTDVGNNTTKVEGSTDGNYTFTANKKWLLQGFVYVNEGATLTIEPGTIIKGDKDSKGTLIIKRGAKINAVGTSASPIVFTSNQPAGSRDYGDWGGIIICGKANNNQPGGEAVIEGGPDAMYGGGNNPNDADNSGSMRYVRIEFPGIAFQPNQEINGLTLGAVGSGTTIDHIQVSYSGDDSYEWFGGTVNVKNIVAFRGWDDDLDTDNGFRGRVQFAACLRDPNIADQSGSNGFESDNDASGSTTSPYTKPVFSNVSIFGPYTVSAGAPNSQFKRGAHIRRNSRCNVHNSVIAGYPTGVLIDGSLSEADATSGELQIRNTIVAGCPSSLEVVSGSTFDIAAWFNTSGFGNSVLPNVSDLGLPTLFTLTSPDLLPNGGSPLLSGADFSSSNLGDAFFEHVSFRGAFGTDNWTSGWCNWDPQNTAY